MCYIVVISLFFINIEERNMASEKQIAANRINGLKGGANTHQSNLSAGLKAVSHGIFSKDVLLPGEDSFMLDGLRNKFITEMNPVGELETILVERIISSTWRLKRALKSENKYVRPAMRDVNNMADYLSGIDYRYDGWQNFLKYETALERQISKAMHELERLQRNRRGEKIPPPLAVDIDLSLDH
jgi:hypothetical protein